MLKAAQAHFCSRLTGGLTTVLRATALNISLRAGSEGFFLLPLNCDGSVTFDPIPRERNNLSVHV